MLITFTVVEKQGLRHKNENVIGYKWAPLPPSPLKKNKQGIYPGYLIIYI